MTEQFQEQVVLISKSEPVYCEFKDDLGCLTNATNPQISIYSPSGSTVVANYGMTLQSTGLFYYLFTPTAGAVQGYYQAWFSGEVGGLTRTTDNPKPIYVRQIPWNWGYQYEFVRKVRRAIGDNEPSNYRISDRELIYYIADAVIEMESKIYMGYSVEVSPDNITFNKTLTSRAETLFKLQTAILVLESAINRQIYDVGYINTGDLIIDKTKHFDSKVRLLKEKYLYLKGIIENILMNDTGGYEIITYGDGSIISNWW